jgi:transposase
MTFLWQTPRSDWFEQECVREDVVQFCAGLDVHRDTVVATVRYPEGARRCSATRTFGTDTAELFALGDWLVSAGVTRVGLESTGVY